MTLIIKTKDDSKRPHLALTHKELQGGSANGRNVSLLMKSDAAITEDVKKALVALGIKDINKAGYYSSIRNALQAAVADKFQDDDSWSYIEDFNDTEVIFCTKNEMYSVNYTMSGNMAVLDDLASPVTAVISYSTSDGKMLLSEDAEDKLEEGVYSLLTKTLNNKTTQEHLIKVFKEKAKINQHEVELLEQEIKKAVEAAEAILKTQLTEKETALTKALADLEVFKTEKLEAVTKARKQTIAEFEKDEAKVDELLKSLEALPQEAFDVVVKSLKEKVDMMENSDLFIKKSKNTDVDGVVTDNATAAILKAKYQKQ